MSHSNERSKTDVSESGASYTFINPLLDCLDQNTDTKTADNIEHTVRNYIDGEKSNGDIIDASFYFRDLNGGPWALVNRSFRSIPASLLKVPLAITVYARANKDPTFLTKRIPVTETEDPNQSEYFKPTKKALSGTTYSVETLVSYMLANSDNGALHALEREFTLEELQNSYSRLGIEAPSLGDQNYTMGVKTYSSFFRVLYNGTYITQEYSEHVLSILSKSTFTQGIVAGVPASTVVAHKFGEASVPDGTLQLHDCGIVYKPHQPYLLCIMTKGNNFDTLADVIAHISELTYRMLEN